jgi:hypothetical protein
MFARIGSRERQEVAAPVRLGTLGLDGDVLAALRRVAHPPLRAPHAEPLGFPEVQFDVDAYVGPARGSGARPVPLFTLFVTARLTRRPWENDQRILAGALNTIEAYYPFNPSGIFSCVGYGLAYFERLPGGLRGPLLREHLPRPASDPARTAIEELAPPEPAEVLFSRLRHGLRPPRPAVQIEESDLLLTLRSDSLDNLRDVASWLQGGNRLCGQPIPSPSFGGLIEFTSTRLGFAGAGLPARLAATLALPYNAAIDARTSSWTGFVQSEVGGATPAQAVTLQNGCVAPRGSYFRDGAVQHLRHAVVDFGGFRVVDDVDERDFEFDPPVHLHADAPGFEPKGGDGMGSRPIVHSCVFAASTADLEGACGIPFAAGGPGRLNCTGQSGHNLLPTRWQTFLVPPRSHRALPLLELLRTVPAD